LPNILVADDNTNIQKMVTLALEEHGIHVVSVGNGEAAVRRIPDLNPDLVLADIFMPVRNGYEVCEFVKKDQRFAHIPVILLVGVFDPLDEKEARRVGADGVLKKPFVPPDPLIAMVWSALEKNPRVAAELAKAKEAKAAEAVEPSPMGQLQIPARAEPKPLPAFPEPSPEEASLAYGFGTGRRALESDDEQAGAAKEPKPPIAGTEEAGEEESDGASTATDWRRVAMDFEVPAEAVNKPAFSSVEDLDPITFPSERDVPPRRIRVLDLVEKSEPAVEKQAPTSAEAGVPSLARLKAPAAEHMPESAPATKQPEPETEAGLASGDPHWMDAVATPASAYPAGEWMVALTGERVEPKATDESAASPLPSPPPVSHPASEEPFFADDAAPGDSALGHVPPAEEAGREAVSDPLASAAPKTDQEIELEPEDAEPPLVLKDPDLVQPPAVHVTPEPLLVDEDPPVSSTYGARPQETAPLHSLFSPASGDPVLEEPTAEESPAHAEGEASSWEPSSREVDERIPTMAPPSREALSNIPFLMSPPAVSRSDETGTTALDSLIVDEVVRKVLEKIEPQLYDLLSQGVLKPLVENLLRSELAKKEG
jgi:CheY-like chemotaxis protein